MVERADKFVTGYIGLRRWWFNVCGVLVYRSALPVTQPAASKHRRNTEGLVSVLRLVTYLASVVSSSPCVADKASGDGLRATKTGS